MLDLETVLLRIGAWLVLVGGIVATAVLWIEDAPSGASALWWGARFGVPINALLLWSTLRCVAYVAEVAELQHEAISKKVG